MTRLPSPSGHATVRQPTMTATTLRCDRRPQVPGPRSTSSRRGRPRHRDGPCCWDERYAGDELVWTAEPNRFLVAEVDGLAPGRALDLACGEGRNAVWLAERGWTATGVDFSAVGLDKARRLADARHVSVQWERADVTEYQPPAEGFDLVIVMYLHLPESSRRIAFRRRRRRQSRPAARCSSSATTARTRTTAGAARRTRPCSTGPTTSSPTSTDSTSSKPNVSDARCRPTTASRRRSTCSCAQFGLVAATELSPRRRNPADVVRAPSRSATCRRPSATNHTAAPTQITAESRRLNRMPNTRSPCRSAAPRTTFVRACRG